MRGRHIDGHDTTPDGERLAPIDLRFVRVSLEDVAAWAALLDAGEISRSRRFQREGDHDRFVVGRGLLRAMLGRAANRPPTQLRFGAADNGKPTLDGVDGLAFNVAHSGDYVLVGVARASGLGVDVERHRTGLDLAALAARVFTAAEQRIVLGTAEPERTSAFFRQWVRKEALLKGVGAGLSADASQVSTTDDGSAWRVRDLPVEAGYSAAVALRP